MKYSELITFKPIESTIQLVENTKTESDEQDLIKTYVMSDDMAENLKPTVIDQLQMDEVIDNKGVLVVGNFGTGKSHLMSVISAIAKNEDNLQYLQNPKFADEMKQIAGKFEILRIEIGGVTMSLREILLGYIQDDFAARGIKYDMPDLDSVKDNKKLIQDFMTAFESKYPDKGFLIVVDEFLSYLTSRDERQIVLDLEFLRALGEMCSKSKFRIILGVQEKIFDNPRFSFVSDTLKHVSDRFTQIIIRKQDTAYVVSERILKKNPEQKAMIREHLEKFTNLYSGMSAKLDEFIDLYPIHPAYIEVLNKLYLIENRHILKNISVTIKDIFDQDVPKDAPGIISFDNYWPDIKTNGLLKSDVTISRVVNASGQLEDIINRSFPKATYKDLAIQIIYALSVHRLTTSGLDVQFGMTAENLKDDLCLFLPMPEHDADFLLGIIDQTLKDIMTTVSGQFIIRNDANNQYYIDVDKVVDYDEKINQKASIMAEGEFNRYFYEVVYACLEWDEKQYVNGFDIYQYDLNWDSHNVFREGYLFMGLPGERSTAQPERDFYIHILPPYANQGIRTEDLKDEVYFEFKSDDDFKDNISRYSAAQSLAQISEGKDKEAYLSKASMLRRKLVQYLSNNKNTCFDIIYNGEKKKMIEVLKGKYHKDSTFKDAMDMAASINLDGYFNSKYPEYPSMKTKITRKNMAENARAAFDYFAGRKTQQGALMLDSFGLIDDEKIKPEDSKYAAYYIDKIKQLPPQGVLNYSDIFDERFGSIFADKKFQIEFIFTPIIFLSLVYAGHAVLTLDSGKTLSASSLDDVPRTNPLDLYKFKYISKPAEMALVELKQLFDILNINPTLISNPNDREEGVAQLVKSAQELSKAAVLADRKLSEGIELWGEPVMNSQNVAKLRKACTDVKEEFSNYSAKYNTPAKLNNFKLSSEEIDDLKEQITLVKLVDKYDRFKSDCTDNINYISRIENDRCGQELLEQINEAKNTFRDTRDSLFSNEDIDKASETVNSALGKIKDNYIEQYFDEHKKKRLGIEDAKRKGQLQESNELLNLRKLKTISIFSTKKLNDIEQDIADLQICYTLTPEELKTSPICPHCGFRLNDKTKNVYGQIDNIETRINDLNGEWTGTLLDSIQDPLVEEQKQYLNSEQQKVIEEFISNKELPDKVDDFFVNAVNMLFQGFEPVVINTEDLTEKLDAMPPCDVDTFKAKMNSIIAEYIKGKDTSKLRIVIKSKASEE